VKGTEIDQLVTCPFRKEELYIFGEPANDIVGNQVEMTKAGQGKHDENVSRLFAERHDDIVFVVETPPKGAEHQIIGATRDTIMSNTLNIDRNMGNGL
jgi:hypothetical protein